MDENAQPRSDPAASARRRQSRKGMHDHGYHAIFGKGERDYEGHSGCVDYGSGDK